MNSPPVCSPWACALAGSSLLLAACAVVGAPSAPPAPSTQAPSTQAPAAPAAVPENSSRVTATVLAHRVWPPGSLEVPGLVIDPEQTLYSLEITILTVEAAAPGVESRATTGETVEVFALDELDESLVGKTIAATLKLTGDTRGVRWFAAQIAAIERP